MEKKQLTSIKDIAREAGVSSATVSRVVSGKDAGRVSEGTRKKILEVVARLNYQPDLNARFLRQGNSHIIGLIAPDITNHFYPELIKGIMSRADQLGYHVVLFDTENSFEKEKVYIETLRAMKVAGIIIAGVYDTDGKEAELLTSLKADNFAVVQVDRYNPNLPISYVGLDNLKASYELTKYMIQLNHQEIALVMPEKNLYIMNERERGYRKAMQEGGLEVTDDMIFYMDSIRFSDVDECMQKIIESPKRFTAIYNANGDMAVIESIKALKKYDLSIPEDIGITGFDDIYVSGMLKPALTTIRQPKYDLGVLAMDILENNIKNVADAPFFGLLEGELVARNSIRKI